MTRLAFVLVPILALSASVVRSQEDITFDVIPAGVEFVSEGVAITLGGDTDVSGGLAATGEVAPGGGVRFPTGSLQLSASGPALATESLTANAGFYSNTIPDLSPSQAYTEVCFKAGAMEFDIHDMGEPTAGGDCLPGDTGWIIDRFERVAGVSDDWTSARAACLMNDMRLAEVFEWQFTCDHAAELAVSDMVDDLEWVTNQASVARSTSFAGAGALVSGSCDAFSRQWIGRSDGTRSSHPFRCVR